jgi:hypothetical protein
MNAAEVERALLSRELPGILAQDQEWVAPAYDSLSIANLPASVAALFGLDLPGALPPLPRELWSEWVPGLRRVVLVIVDGLGYRLLQRQWNAGEGQALARIAAAGGLVPLTSVFPSTTDAALTSLHTGVAPATHGWLAWEMYLRELGVAANAVFLSPVWSQQRDLLLEWGLQPETSIPVPTLSSRLGLADVASAAVISRLFEPSGFTRMLYRGVQRIVGHYQASDFWTHVRQLLRETRGRRTLITAYWGGLDTLGHAYNPGTEPWDAELRNLDYLLSEEFLARLPDQDRKGTLLLITADHGQIRIPPDHILTANEDGELSGHLQVPIMGESRAAFVYPRPGRRERICEYLETAFPGWFHIVRAEQALEAGLMGTPVLDESRARTGELLVLPRADYALQRARPRSPLLGRHGGLTAQEMLVPLIGTRLDAA